MMLFAMIVILGMTAMVIDLGNLMLEKQKLSDAVDAAAISGAQELVNGAEQAKETAIQFANENGVMDPSITVNVDNHKITVAGKRDVPFFFAKIFGFDHVLVESTATAQIKPLSGAKGIVPLSVVAPNPNAEDYGFQFGSLYTLKYDPFNVANGNFGPLALGGTGASNYENNLLNGYISKLSINDSVKTETGNMSGPTERVIKERINLDAYDSECQTYDLAKKNRNCKRIIYLPVIESLNLNGRETVKIIGFASFYIENVGGNGNDSYVTGRFMKNIYSGDWDDENTKDSGLYAVKLVK
ncbi:putative Flp pilus-assembly TadE/G-like protein [Tepidibacillus fermentans]|uniref:Putative Flp pilus-assembly TadE/G-like protein n=2 Tax=Tepidibacillus fermentans TaxID=1281767 RepID=A0A4R3KIF0_9BACI|nr:putative Flp pilus-assembly TadE/G-like protein [Tepidibacillus fermentans]